MITSPFIIELAKLITQFGITLLAAWVAFRWALTRYKAEKTWDRQMNAYVEATMAISAMMAVVGKWFNDSITRTERTEEFRLEQSRRYREAKNHLDGAVAISQLLLSKKAADLMRELVRDLDTLDHKDGSYEGVLDEEYGCLKTARDAIIAEGKRQLGSIDVSQSS